MPQLIRDLSKKDEREIKEELKKKIEDNKINMKGEMIKFVKNKITIEEKDKIGQYMDKIKIFFPNIKDNDIKYKKYEA
jgi:flagellar basal body rod protein FlgB